MMAVIFAELKRRRWSTMWWTIAIVGLIALTLLFYPSIRDQSAELDKSLGNLSPEVVNLFSDTGDFFSPVGYLSSQIFYMLFPLLLSFLAVSLGSSLIAREEQSGTLELLLARPLSRAKLVIAKATSGLLILGTVAAIGIIVCVLLAKLVGMDVSLGGIAVTGITAFLFAALLGSIAFALTAMGRYGRGMSIGVAALVGFASYIATSFESPLTWMKHVSRLLPFHYYHPAEMLGGNLNWHTAVGYLVIVLILGCLAIIGFRRRDIG
jgi:ABC-2 type transport system permease protein